MNKSNLDVVIDNESGVSLAIKDDASGYMLVSMSGGGNTLEMKLSSIDSNVLKNAISFADSLRRIIPKS